MKLHITESYPSPGLFMHTLADLSSGVTITTEVLGGAKLIAGTPIGKDSLGRYAVVKTARTSTTLTSASATEIKIAKGHHFLPGDYIAADTAKGQKIKTVNKQNPEYDLLTLETALGVELPKETPLFQSKGNDLLPKVTPVALTSYTYLVPMRDNLFCAAWVSCVVSEALMPPMPKTIKDALKGVIFL